jgi:hypothetical protein
VCVCVCVCVTVCVCVCVCVCVYVNISLSLSLSLSHSHSLTLTHSLSLTHRSQSCFFQLFGAVSGGSFQLSLRPVGVCGAHFKHAISLSLSRSLSSLCLSLLSLSLARSLPTLSASCRCIWCTFKRAARLF